MPEPANVESFRFGGICRRTHRGYIGRSRFKLQSGWAGMMIFGKGCAAFVLRSGPHRIRKKLF